MMAVISKSVAEKAVCWWDGRKKRSRRIVCRVTHPGVGGRVIGGLESGMAIGKVWGAGPYAGKSARATQCQAIPSCTWLTYIDLLVDVRFTSSALSLLRVHRIVPPVRRHCGYFTFG